MLRYYQLNKVSLYVLCLPLLMVGINSHAEENDWFQHTSIQGFVSQTIISTTDNNFLGSTDDRLSFDFWEAGMLVNTKVIDKLSFSSQLLGREVSPATGIQTRIDFAFFSYPFIQGMNYTVGARLGRIRSSFGFYNETRDIPHTRTGIIMPQSLYYDMTRNSFYSADGVEFFAHRDIGENRLSFQVFFSNPVEEKEELKEAARLNPDEFDGNKGILAKITYGSEFDGFRVGFTYFKPEYNVDVSPSFTSNAALYGLNPEEFDVEFFGENSSFYSENMVTSIEYNRFDWSITFEYSRHKFNTRINTDVTRSLTEATINQLNGGAGGTFLSYLKSTAFETFATLSGVDGGASAVIQEFYDNAELARNSNFYEEAFYLQGLYRIDDQWDVYLRYDYSQPHVKGHIDLVSKWKDINVGSTYRPDENWLVRAEFHYIEGGNRLFSRDNPAGATAVYWTAAMLQLAYKW